MTVSASTLKSKIESELKLLSDTRVLANIRSLLVEPYPVLRSWDYGAPNEQYTCWAVLDDHCEDTGIAYCESGFGPSHPWGLVFLPGENKSIGMDSGWFSTFLEAYFDSFSVTRLPIWRVFKTSPSGIQEPITGEASWEETWKLMENLRTSDAASIYNCSNSIFRHR